MELQYGIDGRVRGGGVVFNACISLSEEEKNEQ